MIFSWIIHQFQLALFLNGQTNDMIYLHIQYKTLMMVCKTYSSSDFASAGQPILAYSNEFLFSSHFNYHFIFVA